MLCVTRPRCPRLCLAFGKWISAPIHPQVNKFPVIQETTKSRSIHTSTLHENERRFTYPAEWAPHAATIMAFPSAISMPSSLLPNCRSEIASLAITVSEFEPVHLFTRQEDIQEARHLLSEAENTNSSSSESQQHPVDVIECPVNHTWARDNGPVYVFVAKPSEVGQTSEKGMLSPGERVAIDFNFNGWGKLPSEQEPAAASPEKKEEEEAWGQVWPALSQVALDENAKLATRMAKLVIPSSSTEVVPSPITLEGGGFVTDGESTLLATESSIICPGRNPGWSKSDLETELRRLLGVEKIIWFKGCRGQDVTDAHVDDLARFVRPGVVLVTRPPVSPAGESDIWNRVVEDIHEVLRQEKDASGRTFEVHVIDEPGTDIVVAKSGTDDGEPQATYVNFYFVNGGIIMPAFGDEEKDLKAFKKMKELFPERKVRQVLINALPLGGGGIHCVTQQIPA